MLEHDPAPTPVALSRRIVVAGAGAAAVGAGLVVTGCSNPETSGGTSGTDAGGAPAGTALGPESEVPVGSAKIFAEQEVVVTQATAGSFAAFSTTCPHQQCAVSSVQGTDIICPCHGSTFTLDGSVIKGPAQTGLRSRDVTVTGGQITLA